MLKQSAFENKINPKLMKSLILKQSTCRHLRKKIHPKLMKSPIIKQSACWHLRKKIYPKLMKSQMLKKPNIFFYNHTNFYSNKTRTCGCFRWTSRPLFWLDWHSGMEYLIFIKKILHIFFRNFFRFCFLRIVFASELE